MAQPEQNLSFSDAVNTIIARTGRGDRRNDIAAYVNQTIRECSGLKFFDQDMIETAINTGTLGQNLSYTWTRPPLFRTMKAVKYNTWPMPVQFKSPGISQNANDPYYYAASNYFVFDRIGSNATLGLAYYTWQRRLVDYGDQEYNASTGVYNPAYWVIPLEKWQYFDTVTDTFVDTLGSDTLDEAAQALVSNWLLFTYWDMILEGSLNKIYKLVGDTVRANSSYALYSKMQESFAKNELSSYSGS